MLSVSERRCTRYYSRFHCNINLQAVRVSRMRKVTKVNRQLHPVIVTRTRGEDGVPKIQCRRSDFSYI
jgi:hypothetical protein